METIVLNQIWDYINPYWFSFIGAIPVGAGIIISQTLLNKTVLKRFNKEDKELKELKERIVKLEKKIKI